MDHIYNRRKLCCLTILLLFELNKEGGQVGVGGGGW